MSAPSSILAPGEVHVWWIALGEVAAEALAVLTSEELARAARFRREPDRDRWMAARAALRHILAGYTGLVAAELVFRQGRSGKPELDRATSASGQDRSAVVGNAALSPDDPVCDVHPPSAPICFNLSHAGERAALAIALREVGIDLEPIDPDLNLGPLIAAGCTPAEAARLLALPASRRVEAFLSLWTLKEAYLKGIGAGLSREPRTIEVVFQDDARATVCDPHAQPATGWHLCGIDAGAGWTAALAVAGAAPVITQFRWPAPPNRVR